MQKKITEDTLIKIFQEMFKIENISVDTDFFDIGGNSLNAIKLILRVNDAFGEEVLEPDTLFKDGRIKALASSIDKIAA